MARHTSPQRNRIDDAYPIRLKIRVPPNGLGNRLSDIHVWLRDSDERVREGSTRSIYGQAIALYFRTPECMAQFLADFPDLELADSVGQAGLD